MSAVAAREAETGEVRVASVTVVNDAKAADRAAREAIAVPKVLPKSISTS